MTNFYSERKAISAEELKATNSSGMTEVFVFNLLCFDFFGELIKLASAGQAHLRFLHLLTTNVINIP